jgi:hypothetical protein
VLQGTIDEFPLMDVLGILQARNKTGRLEIERQAGRGLIYVRLGEPYYAESSLTRSLIGQKLVDIGAITDMQLRKALDHQADSGERLGQILLTHGVISAADVAQAVISQIKDALADLLAWEAGEFRWETGAEVEVEVPLFGGGNGSVREGSNPLAPHVIPINAQEPDTGPDTPQPESVVAQTDFPRGGTTMTGNEVSAKSTESVPEAGQDPSPEVVGSSADEAEDVAAEGPEEMTAPVDGLASETESEETEVQESDPETEVEEAQPRSEPVAESDAQTDPVSEADEHEDEIEETTPENELDEPNAENESQPDADPDFDHSEDLVDYDEDVPVNEPDPESESVHELDESETEIEAEPVASHLDEVEDTEVEDTEPEETGTEEAEAAHDAVAETDLSPLTLVPEEFHVPRIIRSQPAPELDEEFEAVFEATAQASFQDEPLMEDVADSSTEPEAENPYFDPQPIVNPGFGADAFTPIAPVTEFDHPTFVPDNGSAVFDHGSFEPLPENAEAPFEPIAETTDELVDEAVDETPDVESIAETTDELLDDAVDDAVAEAPDFGPIAETTDELLDDAVDDAFGSPFKSIAETSDEPVDEAPESPFWPLAGTSDEQDEPVDESLDSAFAAVVETLHSSSPEAEIEATEPAFEMPFDPADEAVAPDPPGLAELESTRVAPEMPDADLVPVASPPPPPPEVAEPKAVSEVAAEEALAATADPSIPESLKDIKLDRASLVRELSDLLR